MNGFSLSKIDVLILCGGKGERLKGLAGEKPKPMADISGRPFLDILITHLAGFGFRRFILCAGYKGEVIRDYYSQKPQGNSEILTIIEKPPLGTAGAIKNAEPVIGTNPFLVSNGDSFCKLDYFEFVKDHFARGSSYSMVVAKSSGNRDCGLVKLNDAGRITGFSEKKESAGDGYVNAGIYLLDKKIFALIKRGKKTSLEHDIFPGLAGKDFYGYPVNNVLTDIGTPERYLRARKLFDDAG
ncbi:MAG: sugar phosphate nucleotidyltransferase [Candidatus Omnitrophota bacterium]